MLGVYVLTLDQQRSRSGTDQVPELLEMLSEVPVEAAFERTVGDEVQGVAADASAVVAAVRIVLRQGGWHVGVGLGPGSLSPDGGTRSGFGPAFIAARQAVETAKGSHSSVAVQVGLVRGGHDPEAQALAAEAQALLRLIGMAVSRRSPAQREVVTLLDSGMTGKQVAHRLAVSPQAVSGRRTAAGHTEEMEGWGAVENLLRRAHSRAVAALELAG